jgi:DNA-binding response OmpR family regulator
MPKTILVVDDEPNMLDLVKLTLEREGFDIIEARDGLEAISAVRGQMPDLVILDVMMPGMNGFETLKEIRLASMVPVIMLTVQSTETDRVYGLELGADDYVAKPFNPRELASRVRAVLRRAEMPASVGRETVRVDRRLSIDFDRREVVVQGKHVRLRPTEYRLLYHLVSNTGRLISHEALLTKVWGREYRDDTQLLRLYITYLRQKIEKDPSKPEYIINERGLGYRFIEFARELVPNLTPI